MITLERLKELFHYCPLTGDFTRIKRTGTAFKPGQKAGSINNKGYVCIKIDGKSYKAHKLAILFITGVYPCEVDHINGNKSDNSFNNLRLATSVENGCNRKMRSDSRTGFKNVIKQTNGRFHVKVQINGLRMSFGSYEDIELADLVAGAAREKYHGEFCRV